MDHLKLLMHSRTIDAPAMPVFEAGKFFTEGKNHIVHVGIRFWRKYVSFGGIIERDIPARKLSVTCLDTFDQETSTTEQMVASILKTLDTSSLADVACVMMLPDMGILGERSRDARYIHRIDDQVITYVWDTPHDGFRIDADDLFRPPTLFAGDYVVYPQR